MFRKFLKALLLRYKSSMVSLSTLIAEQKEEAQRWRRLLDRSSEQISSTPFTAKQLQLKGKKIVWQYWEEDITAYNKLSEFALPCFESVDRYLGEEYQIIRLSPNTIEQYLDLPERFKTIALQDDGKYAQAFIELISIALLASYGGIWIDAHTYISGSIPQEYLARELFLFSRSEEVAPEFRKQCTAYNPTYWSWQPEFKVRALTSFIVASCDSQSLQRIAKILKLYWEEYGVPNHPYSLAILLNEMAIPELSESLVSDTLPALLDFSLRSPSHQLKPSQALKESSIHHFDLQNEDTLEVINYLWRQRTKY